MKDNFLACYPYLLTHLKSIPEIKAVKEVQELMDLTAERGAVAPLDGAVYVVFDGFSPLSEANHAKDQALEIGFSLILVKSTRTQNLHIVNIGQTLTAIAKSMQGLELQNEQGQFLTLSPFKQQKALPIRYERGFAFYALRFTTTVAIIGD